jgi:alpha-ketoglutarate-dependent taurine dioxygenase
MNKAEEILYKLNADGFVEFENITTDNELVEICKNIGEIIPDSNGHLIKKLKPNSGIGKTKGTFSNRFGFGQFPLHTDTAFWATPVRYILLSSIQKSICPTYFVSKTSLFSQLDFERINEVEGAIFKIKIPNKQFYSSLLFREKDVEGLKYDPACMIAANKKAKHFVDKLENTKIEMEKINWTGNKAVIMDNWRVLHARGIAISDEERELSRIYIN